MTQRREDQVLEVNGKGDSPPGRSSAGSSRTAIEQMANDQAGADAAAAPTAPSVPSLALLPNPATGEPLSEMSVSAPSHLQDKSGSTIDTISSVPAPLCADADFDSLILGSPGNVQPLDFVSPVFTKWQDYKGFDIAVHDAVPGAYSFQLTQTQLVTLLDFSGLAVSSNPRANIIEFTLSRSSLRVRTFNVRALCELTLPLANEAFGIAEEQTYTFRLAHADLAAVSKAVEAEVRFQVEPEQTYLRAVSLHFERPLALRNSDRFELPDDVRAGAFDDQAAKPLSAHALDRALRFIAPFVETSPDSDQFAVELRDGCLTGGTLAAIARVQTERLRGITLTIRTRHIASLRQALACFEDEAFVYQTERYVILRDRIGTVFGFDRGGNALPDISHLIPDPIERDRVLFPRAGIALELRALITSGDTVHLRCLGMGNEASCLFDARGGKGERVQFDVKGSRHDPKAKLLRATVPTSILANAVRIVGSEQPPTYMSFDFYQNRSILVFEHEETCKISRSKAHFALNIIVASRKSEINLKNRSKMQP